jgi:hypothetical protein
MNYFFYQTIAQPNLNFSERFLLYQINLLRSLLQSSTSSEITQHLLEMKTEAKKGILMSRKFWADPAVDLSYLYEMKNFTDYVQAVYNEYIIRWPNNSQFSEDYSFLLVEGATDFSQALKQKHRADLIEQGKKFAIDLSFRSLVRVFPAYLKKKIVDTKGNFITEIAKNKELSVNSISTNVSDDSELDVDLETFLGKLVVTQHRMRVAYQRALNSYKAKSSIYLTRGLFFSLILGVGVVLFAGIFFSNYFSSRLGDEKKSILLEHFIDSYLSVLNAILLYELNQTNMSGQPVSDKVFWKIFGMVKDL